MPSEREPEPVKEAVLDSAMWHETDAPWWYSKPALVPGPPSQLIKFTITWADGTGFGTYHIINR